MTYTQTQWIFLFYIYCICGWIWETMYVSVKNRQWVNRGFLHGPWLPIYGSGAILVLLVTLPVQESDLLIFLVGMVCATTLEYVTGAVMERIFKMRYWDYSDMTWNLNGYVCLPVAVVWGVFSLAMVHLLHPPVHELLVQIPERVVEFVTMVLTVLFTMDVTKSVQNALDLKAFMQQIANNQEIMERLEPVAERLGVLTERRAERRAERRESRKEFIEALTEKNRLALENVQARIQESVSESEREGLEKLKATLFEIQQAIHKAETERNLWYKKEYKHASSILRRNPSARSKEYQKALDELKKIREEKDWIS